jgi:hypothetical protein
MRSFDVDSGVLDTVPGEVVASLRRVDIGAGSEALYRHQLPALLAELTERARGESSSVLVDGGQWRFPEFSLKRNASIKWKRWFETR